MSQECFCLVLIIQRFFRFPSRTETMNQEDQIEFFRKKSSQISFKTEAWFYKDKSLRPNPPSDFVVVAATLAVIPLSIVPFQRNAPHREFILYMHSFGRKKVLHQNLEIPATTEFSSCNLPAKDKRFTSPCSHSSFYSLKQGFTLNNVQYLCEKWDTKISNR